MTLGPTEEPRDSAPTTGSGEPEGTATPEPEVKPTPEKSPGIAIWIAIIGLGGPLVSAVATILVTIITTRANASTVDKATSGACPIGTIVAYGGDVDRQPLPPGWMLCVGQELPKQDFKELNAVLGPSWGVSTDPARFTLPDLRGLFLRGVDRGANRDPDRLRTVGSLQQDTLKYHFHNLSAYKPRIEFSSDNSGHLGGLVDHGDTSDTAPQTSGPLPQTDPALQGTETRPKNTAINWIIRVK